MCCFSQWASIQAVMRCVVIGCQGSPDYLFGQVQTLVQAQERRVNVGNRLLPRSAVQVADRCYGRQGDDDEEGGAIEDGVQ